MGINDPQKGSFRHCVYINHSTEVFGGPRKRSIFPFPNIVMKWTDSKQDVDDDVMGLYYPKCWALSQSIPKIPINQLPTITRVRLNRFFTLLNCFFYTFLQNLRLIDHHPPRVFMAISWGIFHYKSVTRCINHIRFSHVHPSRVYQRPYHVLKFQYSTVESFNILFWW